MSCFNSNSVCYSSNILWLFAGSRLQPATNYSIGGTNLSGVRVGVGALKKKKPAAAEKSPPPIERKPPPFIDNYANIFPSVLRFVSKVKPFNYICPLFYK